MENDAYQIEITCKATGTKACENICNEPDLSEEDYPSLALQVFAADPSAFGKFPNARSIIAFRLRLR